MCKYINDNENVQYEIDFTTIFILYQDLLTPNCPSSNRVKSNYRNED